MNYAYGRVSAADQNLDRQIDCFLANGVNKRCIFTDKKSGKDFERENYKKLLRKLKKGDLLIVKSIDRLGRNYDMIIEEWRHITKNVGADILVLDMPLLDTRSNGENLTGKLISDIVLQLLSYVAQQERSIKARQREGIAAEKAAPVSAARRSHTGFLETVCSYKRKQISLPDALRRTNLKQATFYVLMRDLLRSFSSETPTDPPAPCTAAATDEPDYAPESLPAVIADGLPTDHARARVN
ncbi:MAG: recombinase family protein [Candidatus Borkfalkia sp.]